MKRNLVTRSVGSVLVLLQNREPPSDAEWAECIKQLRVLLRMHGANVRVYVSTHGGAPTPDHRAILQKEVAKVPVRTSVVSDSLSARMTSSTVALSNRNHRSFGVAEIAEARQHLGLTPAEIRDVDDAVKAMAAHLD
jgi:hypothetical protein